MSVDKNLYSMGSNPIRATMMAVWTRAKLAEATALRAVVLGGSNPLTATIFPRLASINVVVEGGRVSQTVRPSVGDLPIKVAPQRLMALTRLRVR